jgi:type II secretory pathway pseudopilin PulG
MIICIDVYSTIVHYNSTNPGKAEEIMQKKRKIGFILEAIIVLILMAALSSIAVPEIQQMMDKEKEELRAQELSDIQGAVAEMLTESPSGALQPIGPTRDMEEVQTNDVTPLVLSDYLNSFGAYIIQSDCEYVFTCNGNVIQFCP